MLGYYALYDDLSMSRSLRRLMQSVYQPLIQKSHNYFCAPYDLWQNVKERYPFLTAEHCSVCEEWIENFFKNRNFFNDLYHREDNVQEKYRGFLWTEAEEKQRQKYAEIRAEDHNKLRCYSKTFEENQKLLQEYIGFLCQNNIVPIVVIPPFTREYRHFLSLKFQAELLEVLGRMEFAIDYYDFNETDIFDDNAFFDMDHLNERGAELLTECLRQIVERNKKVVSNC